MSSRPQITKVMKDALPKKCYNCGSTENLNYHHIIPLALGGNNILTNIAVLCGRCHWAVHHDTEGEYKHSGELIRSGIEKARAEGRKNGRKPADYDHIMQLIAKYSTQFNDIHDIGYELHTETEIMDMAGVKPVCYAKCKRMLVDAMNAAEWPYEWDKPTVHKNRPLYEQHIKDIRSGKRKLNPPKERHEQDLADLRSISLISQYNIDSALAKVTNGRWQ